MTTRSPMPSSAVFRHIAMKRSARAVSVHGGESQ
ncbi:hypothetical protein RKD49_000162 [Streptomyces glaucescens]